MSLEEKELNLSRISKLVRLEDRGLSSNMNHAKVIAYHSLIMQFAFIFCAVSFLSFNLGPVVKQITCITMANQVLPELPL